MTKKKPKSKINFNKIIVLSLLIIIAIIALVNISKKNNSIKPAPPTPIPSIFLYEANPPDNWKTYTDKNYGFSFRYPNGWQIKTPTWDGGRDNYIIMYNENSTECIGMSVSSNTNDMDTEIRLSADGGGNEITKNRIEGQKYLTVNGNSGLIEQLYDPDIYSWRGNLPYESEFFAGAINIKNNYLILDTCSTKEREIFYTIFSYIKVN